MCGFVLWPNAKQSPLVVTFIRTTECQWTFFFATNKEGISSGK